MNLCLVMAVMRAGWLEASGPSSSERMSCVSHCRKSLVCRYHRALDQSVELSVVHGVIDDAGGVRRAREAEVEE